MVKGGKLLNLAIKAMGRWQWEGQHVNEYVYVGSVTVRRDRCYDCPLQSSFAPVFDCKRKLNQTHEGRQALFLVKYEFYATDGKGHADDSLCFSR